MGREGGRTSRSGWRFDVRRDMSGEQRLSEGGRDAGEDAFYVEGLKRELV